MYINPNKSISTKITLHPGLKDLRLVENVVVRRVKYPKKIAPKSLVYKPWGFEYLCGKNSHFEVWELHIEPGKRTSFHAHPDKDTLNIVVEGDVMMMTATGKEVLKPGDFRIIKAGFAHSTYNTSATTARVIEIESPPNKYNLIRISDDFGRQGKPYDNIKYKQYKGKLSNTLVPISRKGVIIKEPLTCTPVYASDRVHMIREVCFKQVGHRECVSLAANYAIVLSGRLQYRDGSKFVSYRLGDAFKINKKHKFFSNNAVLITW